MKHSQKRRWGGVALLCSAALAGGAAVGAQGHAAPVPTQADVSSACQETDGGTNHAEKMFGGRTHRHAR